MKTYHVEFLTATILNWQHLLNDEFKSIIVDSLRWLVQQNRCKIYGFVIMPNHIHLLWKIADGFDRDKVQGALLSFTAHEFKKRLENLPLTLKVYQVDAIDRNYQFWQTDCMVKECWNEWFLEEKLEYIHHNPLQLHWKLADIPENYYWSSAAYYFKDEIHFEFLTHYKD